MTLGRRAHCKKRLHFRQLGVARTGADLYVQDNIFDLLCCVYRLSGYNQTDLNKERVCSRKMLNCVYLAEAFKHRYGKVER